MSAFDGCKNLLSVTGERVSYIGYGAFKDCTSLNELNFTENLKEIDALAFSGCENLLEVNLFETVTVNDTAFDPNTAIIYPEDEE